MLEENLGLKELECISNLLARTQTYISYEEKNSS